MVQIQEKNVLKYHNTLNLSEFHPEKMPVVPDFFKELDKVLTAYFRVSREEIRKSS